MLSGSLDTAQIDTATEEQANIICPACASGNVRPSEVHTAFWHRDRLVVVEDIPALVCNTCQQQFYDDSTVTLLDIMQGEGFLDADAKREMVVPVFSFEDRMKQVKVARDLKASMP